MDNNTFIKLYHGKKVKLAASTLLMFPHLIHDGFDKHWTGIVKDTVGYNVQVFSNGVTTQWNHNHLELVEVIYQDLPKNILSLIRNKMHK